MQQLSVVAASVWSCPLENSPSLLLTKWLINKNRLISQCVKTRIEEWLRFNFKKFCKIIEAHWTLRDEVDFFITTFALTKSKIIQQQPEQHLKVVISIMSTQGKMNIKTYYYHFLATIW